MLWDKKACLKAAFVTIILFSLIDVAAMAMPSDSTPFVRVINGSSDLGNPTGYTMLEPNSTLTDGNWIILTGGNSMRIPAMSVRYDGPVIINASPATALSDWPFFSTFGIGSNYLVDVSPHDLTVPFDTYPVYTDDGSGNNDVKATFYGSSDYKGKWLTVKLLDLTSVSDKIVFTDVTTITNTMKLLTLSDIKNTEIYSVDLPVDGTTGEIQSIESSIGDLSNMHQGYYALVVMDKSNTNMPCIVAEAPIIVTKSQMSSSLIEATPKPGDTLRFIEDQSEDLPSTYTYVVAMVPEADYMADISITSDGSLSGTFVTFKGLSMDETFNVVSDGTSAGTTLNFQGMARNEILSKSNLQDSDYMIQLAKDELAKSNIAIGVKTTTSTSGVQVNVPTTSTMPLGKYIVLSAAIDRNTGKIAAINQTTIYLGGSWTCNLKQGWNLISVPLVPDHTSVTTFFPPEVMSHIIVVWDYDNSNQANPWSYYTTWTDDYEQGTLTTITEQRGYWVLCDSDVDFTVTGSIPDNTNIPIGANWNLVGYPTMENHALTEVYPDACVFWEYDSSNQVNPWSYYTTWTEDYEQGTLTTMRPGYGYWVLKL